MDIYNKGKNIILTAEAIYSNNFTQPNKRFVLRLYYNVSHFFLFVDAPKMCQSKAKESKIKNYAQCLSNILRDFTIDNMKKSGLKEIVNFFSVDFNPIDANNILDIHKYIWWKEHDMK